MKPSRSLVFLTAALVAHCAVAASWPLTGATGAHDPTLLKDDAGWWCFTTGAGLPTKFSADGLSWEQRQPLFTTEDAWWRTWAPAMGKLDVWAPDLQAFNGRVWCYYCVSEFGTNNSAIGLLSCSSPGAGDWKDEGLVLGSKRGVDAYNALDPSLTTDAAGNPWLVFGSWFDGIHLVSLDPATMKPDGQIVSLAMRENGIEAANIVHANGYYYLFVSIDRCCQGVASTYKIAYGRATAITGPYLDKKGVRMLDGGYSLLDVGDTRWIGPGGQDVSKVGDRWVIARHAYDAQANGAPKLLISDLYWDADHWPTYTGPSAPAIRQQPASVTVAPGGAFTLAVGAEGEGLAYQWFKDGVAVFGATGASFTVAAVTAADAGAYKVQVANATATLTSDRATVQVAAPAMGHLMNLSVRTHAGSGAQTLIAGFAVSGSVAKPLLLRGIGPALASFGVTGAVADPELELFQGDASVASNESWSSGPDAAGVVAVEGDRLAGVPLNPKEAALLERIDPGTYTLHVRDASGVGGIALAEVFDEEGGDPGTAAFAAQSRLVDISARAEVSTGAGVLILGFSFGGNVPHTLLIRGMGPTLVQFGVADTLADPALTLYDSRGDVVAANDNWRTAAGQDAIAADHGDTLAGAELEDREAVLLVCVPPGTYTAQVRGANGESGVALADIMDLQ